MGTNNIQGNSGVRPEYRPEFNRDRRSEGVGVGLDRKVRAATGEISKDLTRTLEITTDDGDTVTISIETSAQLQAEGLYAKGPNGRVRGGSVSGDVDVSVNVEVSGELDQEEIQDIGALLRDLAKTAIQERRPVESPAPPAPEGGPVDGTSGETEGVEAAPVGVETGEGAQSVDVPPAVEDGGNSLASYTISATSDVEGDFSRLHNPETWG